MAKKKTKVQTETTSVESIQDVPDYADKSETAMREYSRKLEDRQIEQQRQQDDQSGVYHILYTPLWRSQLDLGTVEGSLSDAQSEAESRINAFLSRSYTYSKMGLNWQQESDTTWIATGDDGFGETTLPLIRLTKVG